MQSWKRKLIIPFVILQIIIAVGVIGFMTIEKYSFIEAVYMTTISITTVGFGLVRPLSEKGMWFVTCLLICSWATLAYVLGSITEFVINGDLRKHFKNKKMNTKIFNLKNHVVICGLGRNGRQTVKTLNAHGTPFVVIEQNEELIKKFAEKYYDILYIVGNAVEDEVLLKANISQAKGLITTLPDDAENVFIVLSARALQPALQIISRASHSTSINKLKKAGADNVIMPDKIGGTHMATLITKPDVIEFIDYLSGEEGDTIHLESVDYEMLPEPIKGKSLHEIMNWKHTGVNSLGIKNVEGKFIINPPKETLITKGMKLIVLGDKKQIDDMKVNLEG